MSDLKRYYDKRYQGTYRDAAVGFEVARWKALGHLIRNILKATGARRVLDYGSGSGLHVPLWKSVFPSARLHFCDVSARALGKLARRFPEYEDRCREISDDQVCFDSETFDVILSVEVMEHVPDLHAYLTEVHRLLEPGGCFVWTTPCANAGSIEHVYAAVTGQIAETDEGYRRWSFEDPSHVRRLKSKEIAAVLQSMGFRRIDFRFRSHFFSFVCTRLCRGPLRRLGEKLMSLDYALFRRLPNGASMIGYAYK